MAAARGLIESYLKREACKKRITTVQFDTVKSNENLLISICLFDDSNDIWNRIGTRSNCTPIKTRPINSNLFQFIPRCGKIKASLRPSLQIGGIENGEGQG
jgi:hypothetical protein